MLREALEATGDQVAEDSQAAALIGEIPENDVKAETSNYLLNAPREFAHHFLTKD